MNKYTIIALGLIYLFTIENRLLAQNCSNDSTGLIPITDLENGFYQGFQGGLYFGSNIKPIQQITNLNNAISSISPRDINGLTDYNSGKIVLLSIGASNPKTEFESFENIADTFNLINPYLKIVNGCKGGNGLQSITDSTSNYWQYVTNQLLAENVHQNQVQVIWLEQENTQSNNINFPTAPEDLMTEFKELFEILLNFYPNLQVCYLTARGYAGYVDSASTAGNGLRMPRDYYQGWAMKWLIEDQILGDSTLSFTGPNRKAPVLDWSAYLWADGINQRNDGFNWVCPDDLKPNDGLHWSPIGNFKAGSLIFERFANDNEAKLWFLNNQTNNVLGLHQDIQFLVFPNPTNDIIQIKTSSSKFFDIYIYNTVGQLCIFKENVTGYSQFNHNLASGLYYVNINSISHNYKQTFKLIVNNEKH